MISKQSFFWMVVLSFLMPLIFTYNAPYFVSVALIFLWACITMTIAWLMFKLCMWAKGLK